MCLLRFGKFCLIRSDKVLTPAFLFFKEFQSLKQRLKLPGRYERGDVKPWLNAYLNNELMFKEK